jgi:cytochrome bd-type quinol oxidase subunit 2
MNYINEMSDQCFWDIYFVGMVRGFLIIAVFVLIMFLAGKIWLNKSKNEKERRLNNFKFWFALWISIFGYASIAVLRVRMDPGPTRYIAECHFLSYSSWLNEKIYPGWLLIAFLIIPIIIEYWSIKTGKKNPSNNSLSPWTILIALVLIISIAGYAIYSFVK